VLRRFPVRRRSCDHLQGVDKLVDGVGAGLCHTHLQVVVVECVDGEPVVGQVGAAPAVGALAVLGFLAGVTPVMHDFWNQEGMDRQNEQIHFLKNAGLAGTALVFLAVAATPWPYAVGPTLL
jgi:hypothetical protein